MKTIEKLTTAEANWFAGSSLLSRLSEQRIIDRFKTDLPRPYDGFDAQLRLPRIFRRLLDEGELSKIVYVPNMMDFAEKVLGIDDDAVLADSELKKEVEIRLDLVAGIYLINEFPLRKNHAGWID